MGVCESVEKEATLNGCKCREQMSRRTRLMLWSEAQLLRSLGLRAKKLLY